LSDQTLLSSIVEKNDVFKEPFLYVIISAIIGLLGVLVFCFKYKVSKKTKSLVDVSSTLSCTLFSVSTAWKLKRLDKLNLDGNGTVIAILDTAINENFFQKKYTFKDFLPFTPINVDACAHGTICSAVAVGVPCTIQSKVIPRGVAPGGELIVYRIAEEENSSNDALLAALRYAQNEIRSGKQIDVISISYDYDDDEQEIYKEINTLVELGVVFVAAAGNRGSYQPCTSIPACFDSVISVGALDKYGQISPYTSKGVIDVYAPGDFLEFCGTSFATPAVGGIVLLLKQWANHIGSPAKENIHRVEILRRIFREDMIVESGRGNEKIFDPVSFFMCLREEPTLLNSIVQKYMEDLDQEKTIMEH